MYKKTAEYNRYFTYDYANLCAIMHSIMESSGNQLHLAELKKELNIIFNKNECVEVIYTNNTDKLFFGMCVMPVIPVSDTRDLLLNDKQENRSIKKYYIEIDSKLNNKVLGFNGMHFTAILLHEIGHIVINEMVLEEYKNAIDTYCSKEREVLDRNEASKSVSLFSFAAFDTIKKMYSFFYSNPQEIYSDNFSYMCGFGVYLQQSYETIVKSGFLVNKTVRNKLLVLQWVIEIYKEFYGKNRIFILRKLNMCKTLSPSVLEKRLVDTTIKRMDIPIDVADSLSESSITESGRNGILDKLYRSGLRGMENELYELKIQAKSTNDRDGCLYILRLINTRLGIVDEYIESHKEDLTEEELERWSSLYQNFCALREELTSKKLFGSKIYGLFTDYTKLPPSYISNLNTDNMDY